MFNVKTDLLDHSYTMTNSSYGLSQPALDRVSAVRTSLTHIVPSLLRRLTALSNRYSTQRNLEDNTGIRLINKGHSPARPSASIANAVVRVACPLRGDAMKTNVVHKLAHWSAEALVQWKSSGFSWADMRQNRERPIGFLYGRLCRISLLL